MPHTHMTCYTLESHLVHIPGDDICGDEVHPEPFVPIAQVCHCSLHAPHVLLPSTVVNVRGKPKTNDVTAAVLPLFMCRPDLLRSCTAPKAADMPNTTD